MVSFLAAVPAPNFRSMHSVWGKKSGRDDMESIPITSQSNEMYVCMQALFFLYTFPTGYVLLLTCFWLLQISPVDVWMTCILKLSRAYFQEVQPYPLEGHSSWIFWLLLSRKWPFHCLWTVHPLGPGHISPGPELWVWVGSHLCPVPITEENITTDLYWLIKSGLITSLSLASAKSLTDISFSSDCWKCWAPVNT